MTLVSTALPAHDASRTRGASLQVASGNAIRIIDAALRGIRAGERAVLAIVLETEGSTYAGTGAMAVFGEGGHVGWLSGGCLEPEIEQCAIAAASPLAAPSLDRQSVPRQPRYARFRPVHIRSGEGVRWIEGRS